MFIGFGCLTRIIVTLGKLGHYPKKVFQCYGDHVKRVLYDLYPISIKGLFVEHILRIVLIVFEENSTRNESIIPPPQHV